MAAVSLLLFRGRLKRDLHIVVKEWLWRQSFFALVVIILKVNSSSKERGSLAFILHTPLVSGFTLVPLSPLSFVLSSSHNHIFHIPYVFIIKQWSNKQMQHRDIHEEQNKNGRACLQINSFSKSYISNALQIYYSTHYSLTIID